MMKNNKKNENQYGSEESCNHTYSPENQIENPLKDVHSLYDLKALFDKRSENEPTNEDITRSIKNMNEMKWTGNRSFKYNSTEWLKSSEVVKKYPICDNTLRKLRKSEVIPSTHENGKYLYKQEDIEAYFNRNYNGKK